MGNDRRLKGINFFGTLDAFEREYGRVARDALLEELSEPLRGAMTHGEVVASGWYPAAWYDALLQGIVARTGGDVDLARRLSREAVHNDFRTLFRVVRLFMTPARALQQSVRVASRYIDGGEIEVLEAQDQAVRYRFREYRGYTRLMWWDFIGGIEGVLTSLGCEDITARVLAGGNDGDHHLELQLRWRS